MAIIGFVAHAQREGAISLAEETAAWLKGQGHEARMLVTRSDGCLEKPGHLDLAVSLGGDGTMLSTVDLVVADDVPVLGVNFGHLGYLTAVEPADLRSALDRFLAGEYGVESRMTLDVSVDGAELDRRCALNDVVLHRTTVGHTMRTEVSVNGVPFLTFASDSLILATPTGSTAYNLSARGPIVSPRAEVFVLTPVAPHMLFDRSLVLHADEEVSIMPIANQAADVVVDGWPATTLQPGQTLRCRRGPHDARLVTFGERNFQQILKTKFNLFDR